MLKLQKNIIYYYDTPCGYVHNDKATIDTSFLCQDLENFCKKHKFSVSFLDGILDVLLENYNGHPISISDVIEIYDEKSSDFYYVDKYDFKKINFM